MATTTTTKTVKVVPYVDWSAIFAGTLIALVVTIVLGHFGAAFGYTYERFAATELTNRQDIWHQFIILSIWTLWTSLMASMAGGYVAGCARRGWIGANHESEVRDGAHGVLSWALSTVVITIAAAVATFWASLAPDVAAETVRLPAAVATKMAMIWSFSLTAIALVSAVAAWWTGTLGGDHRDRSVDVSEHISFRKKR